MEEERDNQETNNSLFTREIEKIFLSDEATGENINSRKIGAKQGKAKIMKKVTEKDKNENVVLLNIYGPFFGTASEQRNIC